MKKLYQPYHLVTISPWPLLISFSVITLLVGIINWFNNYTYFILINGLLRTLLCIYQWWRDVIRERTFQGNHTSEVVAGLKLGIILFIVSELFFFVRIFWCYIHIYLSPGIEIGCNWPPLNIEIFDPYQIPLLNTIILLSSGVTITWCHHSLLHSLKIPRVIRLFITIILGVLFSIIQYLEYDEASFTIADSVFGSIFFLATGFHGLHVLIGSIFLLISLFRILARHYSKEHHLGLEIAIWYWHFVDVVWLFLYLLVYFLSN